nr:hypothetical protein [Tanacetum cinerariifolium]
MAYKEPTLILMEKVKVTRYTISPDPEECGEDKANAIIRAIHGKLNDDWFNNTSEDEDDLERILDYLKPRSYDGFIDLDNEAYNKRRCKLLGMAYKEPTLILMEKVKVTRYTIGPGEIYTKPTVLSLTRGGLGKIMRTCLTHSDLGAMDLGVWKDAFSGVIKAIVKYWHLEPKIKSMVRDFSKYFLETSPCFRKRFSLMLLEHQDIIMKFCSPFRWKELSKETSSKILLCGDGS